MSRLGCLLDVLILIVDVPNLSPQYALSSGRVRNGNRQALDVRATVIGLTARRRKDREALNFDGHLYGVSRLPVRHQRLDATGN